MTPDVAICLGTYNRKPLLETCIASIRRSVGQCSHVVLAADGGSTDGTREWLTAQPDCELLEGGLDGAVKALNVAFARAVDLGCPFVVVFNDDIAFVSEYAEIDAAVALLRIDGNAGAVAFESDNRGDWRFEEHLGLPYMPQGIVRREAGMSVARWLGDPEGKRWWGDTHLTYAADTEFGLLLWRLGWTVHTPSGLRVHDPGYQDAMKDRNRTHYQTMKAFLARFGTPESVAYNHGDAVRCGGVVR